MISIRVAMCHEPGLDFHLRQAKEWLSICSEGENSAALYYAAFELRLAIERLAIHYWATLLNRPLVSSDHSDLGSFKKIEHRIYELGGNQKQINKHFEFMKLMLAALKIDIPLRTPEVRRLAAYWHDCSKLCHIEGVLASVDASFRRDAFVELSKITDAIQEQVLSPGWPTLQEEGIARLRDRFVAGNANEEDLNAHFRDSGLWAIFKDPGGKVEFVGEPN